MTSSPSPTFGAPGEPADSDRGSTEHVASSGVGLPPVPGDWTGFQPAALGGDPPRPYIPPRPASSGGRAKLLVAGAVIAVVAILGVIVAVTSGDDDSQITDATTVPTLPTESTVVPQSASTQASAATTTEAPQPTTTEVPETTAMPSTTAVPETTTTVTTPAIIPPIPEGSVDLGNGVALPVPPGFSAVHEPGSAATLTDNTSVIVAQSAVRSPGIDPMTLTQEYVNGFDPTFPAISYGPTAKSRSLPGEPATDLYTTFFVTFDDVTATTQWGFIDVYVRSDGLTMVVSAYGPSGHPGVIPSASLEAMDASFQRTPLVATPAPLVPHPAFRAATSHMVVSVDGLVAFTAAPGFSIVGPTGAGRGFVTNGVEDVQVDKMTGQADVNAVTASAQAILDESYTGIEYSELMLDDPDPWGVVHGSFSWAGVYSGGEPSVGNVDLYFDPATTNAYVMFRTWFSGTDDSDPYAAESLFMLRTLFNSFTTIG